MSSRVYPRVCGGTSRRFSAARRSAGLSPRVRGNLDATVTDCVCLGSIPACAGEPAAMPARIAGTTVYPRVCGGTNLDSPNCVAAPGLSPRVRGNPAEGRLPCVARGPIPACAGEPAVECRCPVGARAYPRVCGGTEPLCNPCTEAWGLSPRVRGNRETPRLTARAPGPIPACAGEPRPGRCPAPPSRAYPRVCGGTMSASMVALQDAGLSPRVRGNRNLISRVAREVGPIPACAGEPLPGPPDLHGDGAYPRVCGGTFVIGPHQR